MQVQKLSLSQNVHIYGSRIVRDMVPHNSVNFVDMFVIIWLSDMMDVFLTAVMVVFHVMMVPDHVG